MTATSKNIQLPSCTGCHRRRMQHHALARCLVSWWARTCTRLLRRARHQGPQHAAWVFSHPCASAAIPKHEHADQLSMGAAAPSAAPPAGAPAAAGAAAAAAAPLPPAPAAACCSGLQLNRSALTSWLLRPLTCARARTLVVRQRRHTAPRHAHNATTPVCKPHCGHKATQPDALCTAPAHLFCAQLADVAADLVERPLVSGWPLLATADASKAPHTRPLGQGGLGLAAQGAKGETTGGAWMSWGVCRLTHPPH